MDQARLWVSREPAEGPEAIDLGSPPLAARFSIPGDLLVAHSDQVFYFAAADLTLPPVPLVSTAGIASDDLGTLLDLLARSRYLRPPLDQAGAQALVESCKKRRTLGYRALSVNGRAMLQIRGRDTFLEDEAAAARGATQKQPRSPVRWVHALAGDLVLSASWGEAGVQRWRAGHEESERVNIHDSALRCEPAVSPGGMVASVGQNNEVHLWSAETFLPAWRADALPRVREICLLPNDEAVAVLHDAPPLTPRERRLRPNEADVAAPEGATALTLLGGRRGEVLRSIRGLPPGASGLSWSPDGQVGAIFARDGSSGAHDLYLIDLATNRVHRLSGFAEPIAACIWSDDSRVLTCATLRGGRRIARDGATISEFLFETACLEHLATLADGSLLLDSTRALCQLDHGSGQVRWRVVLPWITVAPCVALSPDHDLCAIAHEGEIWVAETASGNAVARWIGHRWIQGGITFVGHHRIAGALSTGCVVVWELDPSTREVALLELKGESYPGHHG
jgi:WD40 repeat protein